MAESKAIIPHFYLTSRIDMTRAELLRDQLQREWRAVPSYQAIAVVATDRALKVHPALNSSYTEKGIVVNSKVNIGVAVSLDDRLLAPVVKDADTKGNVIVTKENLEKPDGL